MKCSAISHCIDVMPSDLSSPSHCAQRWLNCVFLLNKIHRGHICSQHCVFELKTKWAWSLPLCFMINGKFLLSYRCSFTLLQLSMVSDAAWTDECGGIITVMEVTNSTVIQLYLLVFCFPLFSPLSASSHNYTGLSSVLKSLWSVS